MIFGLRFRCVPRLRRRGSSRQRPLQWTNSKVFLAAGRRRPTSFLAHPCATSTCIVFTWKSISSRARCAHPNYTTDLGGRRYNFSRAHTRHSRRAFATFLRCTFAPTADLQRWELVGEQGKRNGGKILREKLIALPQWTDPASRYETAGRCALCARCCCVRFRRETCGCTDGSSPLCRRRAPPPSSDTSRSRSASSTSRAAAS